MSEEDYAVRIEYDPFNDTKIETKMGPLDEFRFYRNELLKECDWTVLSDCGLSAEKVTEWKTYRQALRDMPASMDTVEKCKHPTLPTKPS
tara:strand:+ start:5181 stop:5450 length:270 start_codon:yes stop_codon:yes gene_type:complete